ncbi:DUF924 family protein [Ramlibacter sp.]|uniref:DUF924 family protein n=1 Tax=Ramlibacter sp. TaxID=1917967 RepID=UPI002D4AEE6F|nr:DUF924 family protein [Ramlibacter sp.]HYD74412.1 DUF924 family protein [Ramlibacter sp.]
MSDPSSSVATPADVVQFWREAGPERWFRKDEAFDRDFRDRFLASHEAAARGELSHWGATAEGSLALLVLLDQFPRNAFRGSARMYATDALARTVADRALARSQDQDITDTGLRNFFYLPYMHSEWLPDQLRAVGLARGTHAEPHACEHHDIVARFGRFPHRNPLLHRPSTREEQAFLEGGGFAG